jgi:hypothetical protein
MIVAIILVFRLMNSDVVWSADTCHLKWAGGESTPMIYYCKTKLSRTFMMQVQIGMFLLTAFIAKETAAVAPGRIIGSLARTMTLHITGECTLTRSKVSSLHCLFEDIMTYLATRGSGPTRGAHLCLK